MKAQFEAMGLAMIVILVVLGMFLFILFSFDGGSEAPSIYEAQQLAQNTVSALMRTSVPGCDLAYDDIVEDLALYNRMPCDDPSGEILDEITRAVLNATLDKRDIPYNYTLREIGGENIYSIGTCDPAVTDVDQPGRRVMRLPPTTKTVEALLWLC